MNATNAAATYFPYLPLNADQMSGLMPFLILTIGATLTLILSALKEGGRWAQAACLVTLVISAGFFIAGPVDVIVGDVLRLTQSSRMMSFCLHVAALLGLFLFSNEKEKFLPEIYPLLLFALTGMSLLVSTSHLMFQFIALETLSLAIYVMVALRRHSQVSAEAGMKYFIQGGLASAMFVYGSALIFGATGTFELSAMTTHEMSLLKVAGFCVVTISLLFKVGAAPFHGWVPDVYQGATLSITSFMASAVKFAAFMALTTVAFWGLKDATVQGPLSWILGAAAVTSMIWGNVVAMNQNGLKRMLAYSSIAHTGYLLLGVLSQIQLTSAYTTQLYLFFYIFSTMGAFSALQTLLPSTDEADVSILSGRGLTHPLLGAGLTVFVLAMAGLPLTAGFIGKYLVFGASVNSGHTPLVVVAVLTSVASMYYYLRVVVSLYMKPTTLASGGSYEPEWTWRSFLVMIICLCATLMYGIVPERLIQFFQNL